MSLFGTRDAAANFRQVFHEQEQGGPVHIQIVITTRSVA